MYFPFIISKQFDIDALNEIDLKHYKKFIPVLIPTDIKNCKKNIAKLAAKNIKFILVLNCGKKNYPTMKEVVDNFINDVLSEYENYSLAYVIKESTRKVQIERYLNAFPNFEKSLIHQFEFIDTSYIKSLNNIEYNFYNIKSVDDNYIDETSNNNTVLINDGFNKQKRNVDYPKHSDFLSKYYNYKKSNIIGFGDYTIIGDGDSTGFAAFAVALHLTVIKNPNILIYHFASDDKDGQKNIGRKYLYAVGELVKFVDKNKIFNTSGIDGFRNNFDTKHYPGLGIAKKYSIKNHIEQIVNVI